MTPLLVALALVQGTWLVIQSPCPTVDGIFGAEVVVLDFDGDGHQDLAVGAPGQGAVFLYFGPLAPCGPVGSQDPPLDWQAIVPGTLPPRSTCPSSSGVGFGSGLAAGDYDGDLRDELFIGFTGATANGIRQAGVVEVYTYDSSTQSRVRLLTTLASSSPQKGEGFGVSVAVGHFDDGTDGVLDVAVGASSYSDMSGCSPGTNSPGRVHVFYDGLTAHAVLDNPLHTTGTTDQGCNGAYGSPLASVETAAGVHDLVVGAQGNPDGTHHSGGSVHVFASPFVGPSVPPLTPVHDVNPLPACPPPSNPPPPPCREVGARFSKSLSARGFQLSPELPWTTVLTVGAPRKDVILSGSPLCEPTCVPCGSAPEYLVEVGGAFVYEGPGFQLGRQLDPALDPGYSLACSQFIGFQTTIADVSGDATPDLVFACNDRRELMVWPLVPSSSMAVFSMPGPTGYYLGMTHGQIDTTNTREEVVAGDARYPHIDIQYGRVLILCVQ